MWRRHAIEITWGVVFILAMMGWMLIERMTGLHSVHIQHHALYTNLFALVAVTIYVLALLQKRRHIYHGQMTWKQGFSSGLVLTLVIALLSPLAQWVTHQVISPHFFTNAATFAVETGRMDAEQAGGYFNLTAYMVQGFFGALIMGVMTSAVVSFFVRTRKP